MTQSGSQNFQELLSNAWEKREPFHQDANTDCYRIFHGYSEGLPGVSIDRYGDCAIVNKKAAFEISDEDLSSQLMGLFNFRSIVVKTHQRLAASSSDRVRFLRGENHDHLKVREHGDHYYADHLSLHTNGLYLDARPVRRWLKLNSKGRRILNLFAHTGSLGIAARLGGAHEVIHLDKNTRV